jgi:hypothetical protein
MSSSSSGPNLIDAEAKLFIDASLQKCHETRVKFHSIALNIIVFAVFSVVVGGFLYYRYRTKPSVEDTNYKFMKDQEYVLSKIRYFKEENERIHKHASPITGLPTFAEEEEQLHNTTTLMY